MHSTTHLRPVAVADVGSPMAASPWTAALIVGTSIVVPAACASGDRWYDTGAEP